MIFIVFSYFFNLDFAGNTTNGRERATWHASTCVLFRVLYFILVLMLNLELLFGYCVDM